MINYHSDQSGNVYNINVASYFQTTEVEPYHSQPFAVLPQYRATTRSGMR